MKKKIFFSYTDNEPIENVKLIQAVKLHFSRLSASADLLFNEQQFAMQADESKWVSLLRESECKVHLLSVNYANEEKCMKQLECSIEQKKATFPVLLSAFYWDNHSPIDAIEPYILPGKDKPLETAANINMALTQIVKRVAEDGLGIKSESGNSRRFYVLLALIVFVLGCLASLWAYRNLSSLLAGLTFLMFLCIVSFVLIRIWKPTNISLFKF